MRLITKTLTYLLIVFFFSFLGGGAWLLISNDLTWTKQVVLFSFSYIFFVLTLFYYFFSRTTTFFAIISFIINNIICLYFLFLLIGILTFGEIIDGVNNTRHVVWGWLFVQTILGLIIQSVLERLYIRIIKKSKLSRFAEITGFNL